MTRFLEDSGIAEDDNNSFGSIDSINKYYDEPSGLPIEADSNPNSPFINKSPRECKPIEDDFDTVRATFGPSAESIIPYQTGHRGIEEDQDKAAEGKDNVFRGHY
ncbi:hypothetical protein E4T47_09162 [Aureobasidium subglaciale]|nr:hypothetical protein E4T43_04873 [Aureobasidium subglaciale]KAI5262982.1 hypothetical protein E4T47_09162 [Aureobasidium subglaciale]